MSILLPAVAGASRGSPRYSFRSRLRAPTHRRLFLDYQDRRRSELPHKAIRVF